MLWSSHINILAFLTVMATAATPSLQPCPSSPNCVSSQATDSHFIEALVVNGDIETAFEKLKKIFESRADTTIISTDETTIRVEFRTTLGFFDDAIFLADPVNKVIHIRSASRSGYWDFGKNRRRLEEIRKEYQLP